MTRVLSGFERQLCDIQGRLFELSLARNLDSPDFIGKFMGSKTCGFLDLPYDRLQWAGEEYLLADLLDETPVDPAGESYGKDELFWIGYVYRYWHLLTGEHGHVISGQAGARLMKDCYLGFHTMDVAMAIENIKEIHKQSAGKF